MKGGLAARASLPLQIALSATRRGDVHRYGTEHAAQVAELSVPRGRGPHPVCVLLHGGSWQAPFGKWTMWPLARALRRGGFAVWNLEYRRVGAGGGWPLTGQDVAAGIDHLAALENQRLDLDRVAYVGHSAGGQLALWAAVRQAPVVAPWVVVGLAPVTRLTGPVAARFMGATREQDPAAYAAAEPFGLRSPAVPTLFVHPTADDIVPAARSREYVGRPLHPGVTLVEVGEDTTHRDPIDPRSPAWAPAAAWLAECR